MTPVMLYNDPHPVHRRMAESIGAELIPAEQGNPLKRIRAAISSSYDAPVILEGGVPLFEGAWIQALRRAKGSVILLAADETQYNIHRPLPYYSHVERLIHRIAHRFIDGAIAVSQTVANQTEDLVDGPIAVCNPFILEERWTTLESIEPNLNSGHVVCVGEFRPANGQDILIQAAEKAQTNIHVHLVGKGTEDATTNSNVTRHGYVSDERLFELLGRASLFCLPGRAGAYPVATLEALLAGLPIIVTDRIGTQNLASTINPRFVTQCWPDSIAVSLDWYFASSLEERQEWSSQAKQLGREYNQEAGLRRFEQAYSDVINRA